MTEKTLKRANEIKIEIDRLQHEVKLLPRQLLSSVNNQYAERVLKRRYFLHILKGIFNGDFEMKLTDEDLKALVRIREDKIKELQKELAELH